MLYISTRGKSKPLKFEDALLEGQADDGGLLLPEHFPDVAQQIDSWRELSFVDLAFEICQLYAPEIDKDSLRRIVEDAFSTFSASNVVELADIGDMHILELFHGPTLAFKDVALQVVGRLFEEELGRRDETMNILGATSGDTGSAAIAGVRDSKRINIFVMFPDGRTSQLQELQMTTVIADNVHCIAIDGSFDDCQRIMKTLFNDLEFKQSLRLGAVNSINWARLMVQIVYYFYASLRFSEPIALSVPTGNFGNILSGIIAKRMGAPIDHLILGTNENDILAKFFSSGLYERGIVQQTLSPSMDIQAASNLERFLYLHMDEDSTPLVDFMNEFSNSGRAELTSAGTVDPTIKAKRVDTEETTDTIGKVWRDNRYLIDPHTAVGIAAAREFSNDGPIVSLATAHPAKFPEAIALAIDEDVPSHPLLSNLHAQPQRKTRLPADVTAVGEFLQSTLSP